MKTVVIESTCTESHSGERLGALEELYFLTDRISPSQFLASATISGKFEEEMLRRALDVQQRRHRRLQARVDTSRLPPRFSYGNVPRIGLRTIDANLNNIESILGEELNRRLDVRAGPLMRSTMIRHSVDLSTIVILVSHCIADGFSLLQFLMDTLSIIGGVEVAESDPLESRPVDALRWERFNAGYASMMATVRAFRNWSSRIGPAVAPSKAPSAPWKACTISRALSRELTTDLLKRCKSEGVTVHSALSAAQLLAYGREYFNSRETSCSLSTAINLRNQLAPREAVNFGVYATTIVTTHRVTGDTGFWSLAREVGSEVSKSRRWGEPFFKIKLTEALLPLARLFIKLGRMSDAGLASAAKYVVKPHLAISNLGALSSDLQFGDIKIEAVEYALAAPPGLTMGSIACTFDGVLRWNFMYLDPLISTPKALAVADGAIETLTWASRIGA